MDTPNPGKSERLLAYVDGFNLYYGLKASRWRRYYWLNMWELIRSLLRPTQRLLGVKYFTARISAPKEKVKRQSTYLEALGTLAGVQIFYGKYLLTERLCRRCGFADRVPSEKMTDVNIAVELMKDAFQDAFDTALLVSADSDLTAPVATVRELYPQKRIVVAFPPKRSSKELRRVATAYFRIGRVKLARSQFPDSVSKENGFVLKRPATWH